MFRVYNKKEDNYTEYDEEYSEEKHLEICKLIGIDQMETEIIFPIDILKYPVGKINIKNSVYCLTCVNFDELPFGKFKLFYSKENGYGGDLVYNVPERYFFNTEKVYTKVPKNIKVITDRTAKVY